MFIKELTNDEFRKFTKNYNISSIYQTVEYGLVMNHQNYSTMFLGLCDQSGILAASLILVEQKNKFKYAYAPRGFLIDYNNTNLLKIFTEEIKKYLSKKGIVAVKISPLVVKSIYDKKYDINANNQYFNNIMNNLKNLGYYHFGFNNFFEALKPRYEAVIDLDLPYYMLFHNIRKEIRTKIRSAERNGVKVYSGNENNLEYLYLQTSKKYPRDLVYFKDCYQYFKNSNKIEFFFTKLDTAKYLKSVTKKYQEQEKICNYWNDQLSKSNKKNTLNNKMYADKLMDYYKKQLIKATNYLKNYPDGIVTSSILVAIQNKEAYVLMDGYDSKYKVLNSKHLLIWKLIERYSKAGIKKFNLGGMTNPKQLEYKGLNDFKLNFNAKCIEYIGDLELVTNNALYFMYRNSLSFKKILKK